MRIKLTSKNFTLLDCHIWELVLKYIYHAGDKDFKLRGDMKLFLDDKEIPRPPEMRDET